MPFMRCELEQPAYMRDEEKSKEEEKRKEAAQLGRISSQHEGGSRKYRVNIFIAVLGKATFSKQPLKRSKKKVGVCDPLQKKRKKTKGGGGG